MMNAESWQREFSLSVSATEFSAAIVVTMHVRSALVAHNA